MEEQFEPSGIEGAAAEPQPSRDSVQFNSGVSLGLSAKEDMTVSNSLVFGAAAGRDMTAENGLSISTAVGRDLTISNGASVATVAGKGVQISDGASIVTLCRNVTAHKATLGLLVARDAVIAEDSKVMVNVSRQQAAIFGMVFGAAFALLSLLFKRK